ncbi:hypothetical protein [Aquamicrobium sp.]|uniref:hypothetical protein n=1 Tax=Aquamicrobium sp. TaxID=1872579 RepID=UPI0025905FBF|nr:hypothetical protein [Aquamicrobium sp.]MCK9554153.1 hypothetical protein [Aquamicrobium sp.]
MTIDTQKLREAAAAASVRAFLKPEYGREIAAAADHIDAQAAEIARLREALAEISGYWNRDQNEQAMYDACWHAISTANAALSGEGNAST